MASFGKKYVILGYDEEYALYNTNIFFVFNNDQLYSLCSPVQY